MTANLTTSDLDHQIATLTAVLDRLGSELYDLDNTDPTRLILGTAPLTGRHRGGLGRGHQPHLLALGLVRRGPGHVEQVVERRGTKAVLTRSQLDELARCCRSPSVELSPDVVALARVGQR